MASYMYGVNATSPAPFNWQPKINAVLLAE